MIHPKFLGNMLKTLASKIILFGNVSGLLISNPSHSAGATGGSDFTQLLFYAIENANETLAWQKQANVNIERRKKHA